MTTARSEEPLCSGAMPFVYGQFTDRSLAESLASGLLKKSREKDRRSISEPSHGIDFTTVDATEMPSAAAAEHSASAAAAAVFAVAAIIV